MSPFSGCAAQLGGCASGRADGAPADYHHDGAISRDPVCRDRAAGWFPVNAGRADNEQCGRIRHRPAGRANQRPTTRYCDPDSVGGNTVRTFATAGWNQKHWSDNSDQGTTHHDLTYDAHGLSRPSAGDTLARRILDSCHPPMRPSLPGDRWRLS